MRSQVPAEKNASRWSRARRPGEPDAARSPRIAIATPATTTVRTGTARFDATRRVMSRPTTSRTPERITGTSPSRFPPGASGRTLRIPEGPVVGDPSSEVEDGGR